MLNRTLPIAVLVQTDGNPGSMALDGNPMGAVKLTPAYVPIGDLRKNNIFLPEGPHWVNMGILLVRV